MSQTFSLGWSWVGPSVAAGFLVAFMEFLATLAMVFMAGFLESLLGAMAAGQGMKAPGGVGTGELRAYIYTQTDNYIYIYKYLHLCRYIMEKQTHSQRCAHSFKLLKDGHVIHLCTLTWSSRIKGDPVGWKYAFAA